MSLNIKFAIAAAAMTAPLVLQGCGDTSPGPNQNVTCAIETNSFPNGTKCVDCTDSKHGDSGSCTGDDLSKSICEWSDNKAKSGCKGANVEKFFESLSIADKDDKTAKAAAATCTKFGGQGVLSCKDQCSELKVSAVAKWSDLAGDYLASQKIVAFLQPPDAGMTGKSPGCENEGKNDQCKPADMEKYCTAKVQKSSKFEFELVLTADCGKAKKGATFFVSEGNFDALQMMDSAAGDDALNKCMSNEKCGIAKKQCMAIKDVCNYAQTSKMTNEKTNVFPSTCKWNAQRAQVDTKAIDCSLISSTFDAAKAASQKCSKGCVNNVIKCEAGDKAPVCTNDSDSKTNQCLLNGQSFDKKDDAGTFPCTYTKEGFCQQKKGLGKIQ
jgi:hypothetical protein